MMRVTCTQLSPLPFLPACLRSWHRGCSDPAIVIGNLPGVVAGGTSPAPGSTIRIRDPGHAGQPCIWPVRRGYDWSRDNLFPAALRLAVWLFPEKKKVAELSAQFWPIDNRRAKKAPAGGEDRQALPARTIAGAMNSEHQSSSL